MKAAAFLALLLGGLLHGAVEGTDYYVSPTVGSNNNSGSSDAPFATISTALSAIAPGDNIYLYPGIYTGSGNADVAINTSVTVALAPGSQALSANISGSGGTGFVINSGDVQLSGLLFSQCGYSVKAGQPQTSAAKAPTITVDSCMFEVSSYALYHSSSSYFTNVTFSNNIVDGMSSYGLYSYIPSEPCPIFIHNSTFTSSRCFIRGGDVLNEVEDSTFQLVPNGVALEFYDAPAAVKNCLFTSNQHENNPGAVYIYDTTAQFAGCVFEKNAAGYGGAINSYSSDIELSNCTFRYNGASHSGGGVYIASGSSLQATNCTFSNNAAVSGGACYKSSNSYAYTSDIILENNYSNVTGTCFTY